MLAGLARRGRIPEGPDVDGLVHYALYLKEVLKFAPRGFPGHKHLREVWKILITEVFD